MNLAKRLSRYLCAALLLAAALGAVSCSKKLGYSVMLWSSPEHGLHDGDIVQVYIKSNISQVYVIGTPGTQQKVEVPFWQIMEPQSKAKAMESYSRFREYRNMYATVAVDGLPVRFEPVNTSRQVYRLRKNEVIKILYKGTGVAPTSGSKALEGDWFYVLTNDGTQGWCFSYNLRLYDELSPIVAVEAADELDESLEQVLDKVWYPESYKTMISSSQVDIDKFAAAYRFDPGKESGKIEFNIEGLYLSWPYAGTEKVEGGVYRFKGTPLTMTVKRSDYIAIQYADERGMPKSYNFVTISTPLDQIIAAEAERRNALLRRILESGTVFSSTNYGELVFFEDGTFSWGGYQRLGTAVIPQGAGTSGVVSFDVFLSSKLSNDFSSVRANENSGFDGVITFRFDMAERPAHFLYRIESNGLRFEEAPNSIIKNGVVSERAPNALVLFFGKS